MLAPGSGPLVPIFRTRGGSLRGRSPEKQTRAGGSQVVALSHAVLFLDLARFEGTRSH